MQIPQYLDIDRRLGRGIFLGGKRKGPGMRLSAIGGMLLAGLSAGAAAENWRIAPQFSVSETFSNNVTLAPAARAESGWVSDLAPGIRIEGTGARARLLFDLQLHKLFYSNDSRLNGLQRTLTSSATIQPIENWLFVDAVANISQQNRSAFGATTQGVTRANANATETSVYQLSPYIRGRIFDAALYQLRFSGTQGSSGDGTLAKTRTASWVATIKNIPFSSKFGWALDASTQVTRNAAIGRTSDTRVRGTLTYEVRPQLFVSAIAGRESNDYVNQTRHSTGNPGFGIEWSPNSRTHAAFQHEKRFFGEGHTASFSNRTPQSAWRFTDTKDVSSSANALAATGPGAIYNLMVDLLTSDIPDPVARAEAARRRLEQVGIQGGSTSAGGFLSSRIIVNRSREASAALLGSRNTLTLAVNRQDQRALVGAGTVVTDSFAASGDIRQLGISAAWAHRLSPLTSMTLSLSRLKTDGLSGARPESVQRAQTLVLNSQLGPRTTWSLGVRNGQLASSLGGSYHEKALVTTLALHF